MKLFSKFLILFFLVTFLSLSGCGRKGRGDAAQGKDAGAAIDSANAIRVVAVPVQLHAFEDWGNFSAELRGSQDAVLTSGMGGRVAKITDVGKSVKAGEALCDIESARYEAMLMQARSAMELAKGELERQKSNVQKGFVGKAVLDKAELDYQSARVALLQAQRAYEDSRCQAPFDGMLVSCYIERYQTVPPGSPTVRIAVTARLEAVVSIPESEAGDFEEGEEAEFRVAQDAARVFKGRLKSIDRAIEARNRTVTARIEIPNPGNTLKPGMVGRTRILRKKYTAAIVIPSSSVLRLQEGTAVMVVRDGKAQQIPVILGPAAGDSVVVVSGLMPEEILITKGAFQVSQGTPVLY